MEEVYSSETLVSTYKSTRRCNPEDQHRHLHRRDNLKSNIQNEELHNFYSSSNIIRVTRSRTMIWAEHAAYIGRTRRRWEDVIKLDFEEGVDRNQLAQGKVHWRALVNTATNLQCSIKGTWATVSFLRRTLFLPVNYSITVVYPGLHKSRAPKMFIIAPRIFCMYTIFWLLDFEGYS
jgi:hypothetical protein